MTRVVFVVGCQRSGTTLMGQILGAHPSAVLVDETDEFYSRFEEVFRSPGGALTEDILAELLPVALTKYARRHPPAPGHRPQAFVFQAPNLTFRAREIAKVCPGSRVIYMLRDVRAVVASMKRLAVPFVANQIRFFRASGFIEQRFPLEWQALVNEDTRAEVRMALVARIKMALGGDFENAQIPVHPVKYEDLVTAPAHTIASVARFLDWEFDGRCLQHEQVLVGVGPGCTDRARSIDGHSRDAWMDQLEAAEEDAIWQAVGDFYERLGYQRQPANPTPAISG